MLEISLQFEQVDLIESVEMIGTVRRLQTVLQIREETIATETFLMHELNGRETVPCSFSFLLTYDDRLRQGFDGIVDDVGHGIAREREPSGIESQCSPWSPRCELISVDESITCSETFHSVMHESIAMNDICPCVQTVSSVVPNDQ